MYLYFHEWCYLITIGTSQIAAFILNVVSISEVKYLEYMHPWWRN